MARTCITYSARLEQSGANWILTSQCVCEDDPPSAGKPKAQLSGFLSKTLVAGDLAKTLSQFLADEEAAIKTQEGAS